MFELGSLMQPRDVAQARIMAGGFWEPMLAALRAAFGEKRPAQSQARPAAMRVIERERLAA